MPPVPSSRTAPPNPRIAEGRAATENARRLARLTYAKRTMIKVRDGNPGFTPEQIDALCAVLRGASE
jgi:hypothetical protein